MGCFASELFWKKGDLRQAVVVTVHIRGKTLGAQAARLHRSGQAARAPRIIFPGF